MDKSHPRKHQARCPHCNKGLTVPEQMLGRKVKCPSCGQLIKLPPARPAGPVEAPKQRKASEPCPDPPAVSTDAVAEEASQGDQRGGKYLAGVSLGLLLLLLLVEPWLLPADDVPNFRKQLGTEIMIGSLLFILPVVGGAFLFLGWRLARLPNVRFSVCFLAYLLAFLFTSILLIGLTWLLGEEWIRRENMYWYSLKELLTSFSYLLLSCAYGWQWLLGLPFAFVVQLLLITAVMRRWTCRSLLVNTAAILVVNLLFAAVLYFPVRQTRWYAHIHHSRNNLVNCGIALWSYEDNHGRLPTDCIRGQDGSPLLSWRVALLPFIEQDSLYKQFKLDEPWDSPDNKKLLDKMPKLYAPVGVSTPEPYLTYYRVFVGHDTVFPGPEGLRIGGIPDGPSRTILVVEAGEPVPWTKPDELSYEPGKPLPRLGGLFKGHFNVLLGDGRVILLKKNTDEKTLRALITRDGGEELLLP